MEIDAGGFLDLPPVCRFHGLAGHTDRIVVWHLRVVGGDGRCRSKQKGAESKPTLSVASSIHVVDAKTSLDFLTRIAISRDAEKALHVEIRLGCYVERRVHRMHHRSAQCELSRRKRSGSIVCACFFIL